MISIQSNQCDTPENMHLKREYKMVTMAADWLATSASSIMTCPPVSSSSLYKSANSADDLSVSKFVQLTNWIQISNNLLHLTLACVCISIHYLEARKTMKNRETILPPCMPTPWGKARLTIVTRLETMKYRQRTSASFVFGLYLFLPTNGKKEEGLI